MRVKALWVVATRFLAVPSWFRSHWPSKSIDVHSHSLSRTRVYGCTPTVRRRLGTLHRTSGAHVTLELLCLAASQVFISFLGGIEIEMHAFLMPKGPGLRF